MTYSGRPRCNAVRDAWGTPSGMTIKSTGWVHLGISSIPRASARSASASMVAALEPCAVRVRAEPPEKHTLWTAVCGTWLAWDIIQRKGDSLSFSFGR